jgi:hypothetical protein
MRTTPNRSIGFTPFFLDYGAEAVLPTDIEFDAPRVVQYIKGQAKEAHDDSFDLLEEAQNWPCPERRSTSSSCGIITAERFVLSNSAKETSCSG